MSNTEFRMLKNEQIKTKVDFVSQHSVFGITSYSPFTAHFSLHQSRSMFQRFGNACRGEF